MENRAFLRWLLQTPWLALLGAFGLILFLGDVAEKGHAVLEVPGWAIQATGAFLYALFLLLVTYHHQKALNERLAALEDRADEFRARRLAELGDRIIKVTQEADEALNDDNDYRLINIRPQVAATMLSLEREFQLGLDVTSAGDARNYLLHATSYLITAWPFIRDNHLNQARGSTEKYNRMLKKHLDENGLIKPSKGSA